MNVDNAPIEADAQLFPSFPLLEPSEDIVQVVNPSNPLPPVSQESIRIIKERMLPDPFVDLSPETTHALPRVVTGVLAKDVMSDYASNPAKFQQLMEWDRQKVRTGTVTLPTDPPNPADSAPPCSWLSDYRARALKEHRHATTGRSLKNFPHLATDEPIDTTDFSFEYYLRLRRTLRVRLPRDEFERLCVEPVDSAGLSSQPFDTDMQFRPLVTADAVVCVSPPVPPRDCPAYPSAPLDDFCAYCTSPAAVLGYFTAAHQLPPTHTQLIQPFVEDVFAMHAPGNQGWDLGDDDGPGARAPSDEVHAGVPRALYRELQDLEFEFISGHDFRLLDRIGHGAFGTVYKAVHVRLRQCFAIKIVDMDVSSDGIDGIMNEISTLTSLPAAPHLVSYFGARTTQHLLWLVMEYVDGGALADRLRDAGRFTEQQLQAVCRGVVKALCSLAVCQRIHRDLKPANILVSKRGAVKLADFGTSGMLTNSVTKRDTFIGSLFWLSPEVTRGLPYDGRADVWSLGICALELLLGRNPLRATGRNSPEHMYGSVAAAIPADRVSPECADFLRQCLHLDMEQRATALELMRHPFLRDADPTCLVHERAVLAYSHDAPGAQGPVTAAQPVALLALDGYEWDRYPLNTVLLRSQHPCAWQREDDLNRRRERAFEELMERRLQQWLAANVGGQRTWELALLEHYMRCKLHYRAQETRVLEEAMKLELARRSATHLHACVGAEAGQVQRGFLVTEEERRRERAERARLLERESRRRTEADREKQDEELRARMASMSIHDLRRLMEAREAGGGDEDD